MYPEWDHALRSSKGCFIGYGYFGVVVAASEQVFSDCLCTPNGIKPYVVQMGVETMFGGK